MFLFSLYSQSLAPQIRVEEIHECEWMNEWLHGWLYAVLKFIFEIFLPLGVLLQSFWTFELIAYLCQVLSSPANSYRSTSPPFNPQRSWRRDVRGGCCRGKGLGFGVEFELYHFLAVRFWARDSWVWISSSEKEMDNTSPSQCYSKMTCIKQLTIPGMQ